MFHDNEIDEHHILFIEVEKVKLQPLKLKWNRKELNCNLIQISCLFR